MTLLGPQDDDQQVALVAYLHDRDEPCPACKYNLRNLTSNRCPECGNTLRVGVALADPYLKAWIALIVALLPPATFGGLIIVIFCYEAVNDRYFHAGQIFDSHVPVRIFLVLGHLLLSVPLAIAAIVLRRRFLKNSRATQRLLAGLAWGAWLVTIGCILNS